VEPFRFVYGTHFGKRCSSPIRSGVMDDQRLPATTVAGAGVAGLVM